MNTAVSKICVVCGQNVAGKPRTKDTAGNYYCQPCYDRAATPQPSEQAEAAEQDALADLAVCVATESTPTVDHSSFPCPSCGGLFPYHLMSTSGVCRRCAGNANQKRSQPTKRGNAKLKIGVVAAIVVALAVVMLLNSKPSDFGLNGGRSTAPDESQPRAAAPPPVAPAPEPTAVAETKPVPPQPSVPSSPVVLSVSAEPVANADGTPNWRILIVGNGFGTKPAYNGLSENLRLTDLSQGGWVAGTTGCTVGVNVTDWNDHLIVVNGFTGAYGSYTARAGDNFRFHVVNPVSNAVASDFDGALAMPTVATATPREGPRESAPAPATPPSPLADDPVPSFKALLPRFIEAFKTEVVGGEQPAGHQFIAEPKYDIRHTDSLEHPIVGTLTLLASVQENGFGLGVYKKYSFTFAWSNGKWVVIKGEERLHSPTEGTFDSPDDEGDTESAQSIAARLQQ